jgi:hypothetical protein
MRNQSINQQDIPLGSSQPSIIPLQLEREITPLRGHCPALAHEISVQFLLHARTEPLPPCVVYPTVNL